MGTKKCKTSVLEEAAIKVVAKNNFIKKKEK
jgi:hypothetical protein